ncbi:DUF429 domain-containing protein [Thermus altitudinis]|uniref:DUF429 domain-containing protein n=1 Tax=Thermus altitudinis TaxID=2908145 RepID=UPI00311A9AB1
MLRLLGGNLARNARDLMGDSAGGHLLVAGVDGCRGGWLVVLWDGHAHWEFALYPDFKSVLTHTEGCEMICVDMPVGLLDQGVKGGRQCERWARQLLGWPRSSSVFSAPPRAALNAETFHEAQRLSYPAGLTKQVFALFPKLREVDALMTPELQSRVKETHPELAFYAMNGNQAIRHSKKTKRGQADRQALLVQLEGWPRWFSAHHGRWSRGSVVLDDILDASIAAWAARQILEGKASRIPPSPPKDSKWLYMEMWY